MDRNTLTARDVLGVTSMATRQLAWVTPHVTCEIARWGRRAGEITDPTLRDAAVRTLREERLNVEGAAHYATLPLKRSAALVRTLTAFQIALDYLDTITERPDVYSLGGATRLHRALADAVAPEAPVGPYFEPGGEDDGGYLEALVVACQHGCLALPGFPAVAPYVGLAARRLAVQAINHDPDPLRRGAQLQRWSALEFPGALDAWWELCACGSSNLGLYALLAIAANDRSGVDHAIAIDAAYHPAVNTICTLMDAFADRGSDARTGAHNYLDYYASDEVAGARLAELAEQATACVRRLPVGRRHLNIVTAMLAMYLARTEPMGRAHREMSERIAAASGPIMPLALPLLRAFTTAVNALSG